MRNAMARAEARKFSPELRSSIASDGRGPAKKVKPRGQYFNDCVRREGLQMMIKRVAAPVIHAYQEVFVSIIKQIQTNMLHWVVEVR